MIKRKVLPMNRLLGITALLFMLSAFVLSQTSHDGSDGSTLRHSRHKVSCLCGTVTLCAGDVCGLSALDDDIIVQLRSKTGMTILDSQKVLDPFKARGRKCTTQVGTKVPCPTIERTFCFEGKRDGDYQLAVIASRNGVRLPAVTFPTNYSRKRDASCRSYAVEPWGYVPHEGSRPRR